MSFGQLPKFGQLSKLLDNNFKLLFDNLMELSIRCAAREMTQDTWEPLGPGTYTWKSSAWRRCLKLCVGLKEKVNRKKKKKKKKPNPRYLACG